MNQNYFWWSKIYLSDILRYIIYIHVLKSKGLMIIFLIVTDSKQTFFWLNFVRLV